MSIKAGRRIYLAVHKYTGLVLGAWIALVGITGSILVYQREWEAARAPALYRVPPSDTRIDLDAALAAVAAAYPDQSVVGIERDLVADNETLKFLLRRTVERSGPQTVIVAADAQQTTVFVDPFRGTIVGAREGVTWLDQVRALHLNLLIGPVGRTLTGVFGIALFASIVAGVVLWWPSAKRIGQAFTLRWTKNTRLPRKMWDLHHVVGIYALIILVIVTFTGAVLIFQSQTQALVGHVIDVSPAQVAPSPDLGAVGLTQAEQVLRTVYPGSITRRVALPNANRATYLFQIVPLGRSNMFTTNVAVKTDTGQIAYLFDPARQAPARSFIGLWSVFIHNGMALGTPGRWLVLLSGLVYVLLLGSGVYIWVKKV